MKIDLSPAYLRRAAITACLLCALPAFARAGSVDLDILMVPLQQVSETARLVARTRLRAAASTRAAPEWKKAVLGSRAIALYRPDVEGVAYFEIPVLVGGKPAGVITVSTGPHDFPVVFWRKESTGPAADLVSKAVELGQPLHRLYRLGPVDYVGEDRQGEVIGLSRRTAGVTEALQPVAEAASGVVRGSALPRGDPPEARVIERASWADAKAKFSEFSRAALASRQQASDKAWSFYTGSGTGSARAVPTPVPGKQYSAIEAPADMPVYNQIPIGTTPNASYCASGCGPTAWAMVTGWYDRRAATAAWARSYGRIYTSGPTDVPATLWMSPGTLDFIWDIRSVLGTDCSPGVPAGWTLPYKMGRVTDWLKNRGVGLRVTEEYSNWFVSYASIRDHAIRQIQARRPAVIGIGHGSNMHYPVAVAYQEYAPPGAEPEREFFVNMGWGGSRDGWIPADIWYSGGLEPLPFRPDTCVGLKGQALVCCRKPFLPVCSGQDG